MTYSSMGGKTVHVRTYLRCRFGKWENVRYHWRKPPER